MRPPELFAHKRDFVVAQRRAVGTRLAALVRGAEADDRATADQRRAFRFGNGGFDGGGDLIRIVAVYVADHLPTVGFEAPRRVVREPATDFAVDADAVVVIQADKLAEAMGTRERCGFVRDSLHEATVAGKYPGSVINNRVTVSVVARGENLLRKRHADGIRETLTKRTRRRLDTRRLTDFGMTRRR